MSRVLIFSIATNGYEKRFARLLETQRALAASLGAEYWAAMGSPPWGISANDSAWLKIPLVGAALARGFDWVVFLDADCEILTPESPVAAFTTEAGAVFVCHDISGRINSGMFVVRNTPAARRAFRRLCWSAWLPAKFLPRPDRNLYENGHVIAFLKNDPAVCVVDERWNCFTREKNPVVFHHGGGAMRVSRPLSWSERWGKALHGATTAWRLPWHAFYFRRHMPRAMTKGVKF